MPNSAQPSRQSYYPEISKNVPPEIVRHLQNLYAAVDNHDAAIVVVNNKIPASTPPTATATKTAAVTNATSFPGGNIPNLNGFPGLGLTNNQSGATAYTCQSSDNGSLIILSNAAPVAVSLNSAVSQPFFFFASNEGNAIATLTPTSGTVNGAASYSLPPNATSIVSFFSGNWYASAIAIEPVNTPAIVHEWLASYDSTTGAFTQNQPSFADVSGSLSTSQLPTVGVSGVAHLAALTIGGTPGSLTVTNGLIVGIVNPT